HIIGGNQQIPQRIAARNAAALKYGMRLVRARKTSGGQVELTFDDAGRTRIATHDAVVLAIPFSVLRTVDLDASLGLPPWKRLAIDQLGYGTNAKMMMGFNGRPWNALGSSGASYSDLAHHQATWE